MPRSRVRRVSESPTEVPVSGPDELSYLSPGEFIDKINITMKQLRLYGFSCPKILVSPEIKSYLTDWFTLQPWMGEITILQSDCGTHVIEPIVYPGGRQGLNFPHIDIAFIRPRTETQEELRGIIVSKYSGGEVYLTIY